jgi:hypothetical protein
MDVRRKLTKLAILTFAFRTDLGDLGKALTDEFGLDTAFVRIGVDYGITNNLMVSFGRSKLDKEFDLSGVFKVLQQSSGSCNMPIIMSVYGGVMCTPAKYPDMNIDFGDRLSTMVQVRIARNFMERLTLQIAPIWVYNGMTNHPDDSHHIFSVGLGGHLKITKKSA